jgi:hypothetical protein
VLTAAAAVQFFVWACRGYFSVVLFTVALCMAIAALLLLPLWVILLGEDRAAALLIRWFIGLCAGTPVLAAIFAVLGDFNCAAGALIVAGLFALQAVAVVIGRALAHRGTLAGRLRRRRSPQ